MAKQLLESQLQKATARIAGLVTESLVDGPGIRSTLFFQGCTHFCDGCHNPATWDEKGGTELTLAVILARLQMNPLISGVTFSGGEPFCQAEAAALLGKQLRAAGLNLWVYTGYYFEELLAACGKPGVKELLMVTDVLVDGPFVKVNQRDNLVFRGSSNQRLIRVAESITQNRIIQWEPAAQESLFS